MDISRQFGTDQTRELEGVWQDLDDTTSLLIGRAGNKRYAKMLSGLFDKNKRLLDTKSDAAEAKSEAIMIDVLASTVLLGWKGIEEDGKPLEYSLANAKRLLAIKDFRRAVAGFAEDIDAYKAQAEVEALGN